MIPVPLQLGIPVGPELLIILLINLLATVLSVYYVYNDATKRNNESRTLWTVATIIGGFVGGILGALLVVVLYLVLGRD